jgi:acyl-CoA reductase-like NAD-dependent aldehyde dehydrogenase|tara:strand:+ start:198015 stop:199427 length:1413 start_codon:yes stop_codon:yes gene_type:complete
MKREYHLTIDGQPVPGASTFDVINPATGEAFAQCPKADEAQLELAVAAARRAFAAWAATPIEERGKKIAAIADAIEARISEFASLLTEEQGKPLDQATGEMKGTINVLRAFSEMRHEPKTILDGGGKQAVEYRKPLGVVAAIVPWNFPVILLANKFAPALVAGNTIIIKPAPTTPLTALLFAEVCRDILPAGVVNLICDENDLGALLSSHPEVDKVSFTGSTETGRKVMASAAAGLKRITLELGGNDASIVLDDVDPIETAQQVFNGAMRNAGQICVAIKRVYVPEAIYDEFCTELARLAEEAIVDDGARQGTQIGPIQNRQQFEKVSALLDETRGHARIIAGGKALDRPGYFIPPTIVRDIADDALLVREEQFGPVLPVLKYTDIDDLVDRANATPYGLGGTIWSKDVARATQIAQRLSTGTVWINQLMAIDPRIPFRGAKQSGIGVEGGQAGFEEYTQAQIINTALPA